MNRFDLTGEQTKAASEIFRDIGQISLASVVVPFLIPEFSPDKVPIVAMGLLFAVFCWHLSLKILKNIQ